MSDHNARGNPTLELRIDALVLQIGQLISKTESQDKLRRRMTVFLTSALVLLASTVVGITIHQSRVDRHQAQVQSSKDAENLCLAQNVTRGVVRDLLVAARDATPAEPPANLTPAQAQQYQEQVAQAKAFYVTQLEKVQPIVC